MPSISRCVHLQQQPVPNPGVRTLLLWAVTGEAFYFHTGASTHPAKEIKKNPKVEICFTAPPVPPHPARMRRVTGFCEYGENKHMKARLLDERPSLISLGFIGPDDPELVKTPCALR